MNKIKPTPRPTPPPPHPTLDVTKEFISSLGIIVIVLASIGLVVHRFSYPDMTQVRWFIEFWYIWLGWFLFSAAGFFVYNRK